MTLQRTYPGSACVPLVLAACLLSGCEEEPATRVSSAKADGGSTASSPAIDPNIARAVREAAKAAPPTPQASGGDEPKPPETGVFPPGEADKAIRRGEPPKLTLGSDGGSPKLTLGGLALEPKKSREVAVTMSLRTGPRAALPTVDLLLKLEPSAPKSDDDAASGLDVHARLTKADLSAEQPGRLPEGVGDAISKLKGSRFEYHLTDEGALTSIEAHPEKDVEGVIVRLAGSVAELAPSLHLPYPKEPVGPGAYWMVTSRERYVGLDVVAYRMLKLEKLDGSQATLSLATKRYAAGGQVDFPGLPPHEVAEFRGEGRGELVVDASAGLVRGRVQDSLLGNLQPGNDPQRRITVQLDVTSTVQLP